MLHLALNRSQVAAKWEPSADWVSNCPSLITALEKTAAFPNKAGFDLKTPIPQSPNFAQKYIPLNEPLTKYGRSHDLLVILLHNQDFQSAALGLGTWKPQ